MAAVTFRAVVEAIREIALEKVKIHKVTIILVKLCK
jgi:hypothetical protein